MKTNKKFKKLTENQIYKNNVIRTSISPIIANNVN